MTKQTADRLFWFCVTTSPLSWLLLVWVVSWQHPAFVFESFPWLMPPFLACYAWMMAFALVLFQPIGRPKKLVLILLVPAGCGILMFVLFVVLMFKLVGFAP